MSFYVYVLRSEKDGNFYIGQTNDVSARLLSHNEGKVISTRNRRPMNLITFKLYETRAEAMKMEKYVKSLKGGNGFKKLLIEWKGLNS